MRTPFYLPILALIAAIYSPLATPPASAATAWESDYAALLTEYASSSGVAYEKWKANAADLATLKSVTDAIAAEKTSGKSRDEKLAFYLNAYNAWILHNILEDYPTRGPGNGSALKRAYFFKSKSITVAGKKMSFSALENDIIRPDFNEPRIHFALNCASASCPPLNLGPFTAATLDADLDKLARAYVNHNAQGLRLSKDGKTVHLSEIFDWYADDFQPGRLPFINKFREEKLPSTTKVEFQDYNWSLNEA